MNKFTRNLLRSVRDCSASPCAWAVALARLSFPVEARSNRQALYAELVLDPVAF